MQTQRAGNPAYESNFGIATLSTTRHEKANKRAALVKNGRSLPLLSKGRLSKGRLSKGRSEAQGVHIEECLPMAVCFPVVCSSVRRRETFM